MTRRVVVIGAGIGGLCAAARLARSGFEVTILEAGSEAGGLARSIRAGGLRFDAGAYVVLDRPGLGWLFKQLGRNVEEVLDLKRIESFYEVASAASGRVLRFDSDLHATASGFEAMFPGSGANYRKFVEAMSKIYSGLEPLLTSEPTIANVVRHRTWRYARFLLRSLGEVLRKSELPDEVIQAISIWTHVAAQKTEEAPSPLGFVPALIHGAGAYYPAGGMGSITDALAGIANEEGVEIRFETPVRRIVETSGRVSGVETTEGEKVPADIVLSNASGIGTYVDLVPSTTPRRRNELQAWPLQSPGICLYLSVAKKIDPPYLRFRLGDTRFPCQLLVVPAVMDPDCGADGRWPARVIVPIAYEVAEGADEAAQERWVEEIVACEWWSGTTGDFRVVGSSTPHGWGKKFHLYRDSMNPVMTAKLMRRGRIPHRGDVRGLYLAGSSTHPGQWVSFAGISGILAGNAVIQDHP